MHTSPLSARPGLVTPGGRASRVPRSLCDFVLSLADRQLRSVWNQTLSDGRERAVTLFRERNGVYTLTPVRRGQAAGVRSVPAPNGTPHRVNIHTHPPSFSTGLSVTDYHTFARAFIVGAPFDAPPPRPAGYAVLGDRNDGAADRPGPALYALRATEAVRDLGPVERSQLAQEVRSAETPDEARRVIEPYHSVCSKQF